ncbi:GLPGLI family protein [Flavobacterium piscis]|uniref:GLPGLI family protein n=1 Tax=Flavobacterium piscis TaxID=1114874 RepID=A0ABU1Y291_9FLAO|nr:GLPGLI family protein [Flavobacterium piscis]MDR7208342.1 GLPGLI family protein [Flavobacterium piscis]
MKYLIIALLLFSISYSQNLKVEFNFTINKSNDLASTTKKYILEQNESKSIFYFEQIRDKTQFKNSELAEVIFDRDSIVAYIIGDDVVEFFRKEKHYKDFKNNLQYYNFAIAFKLKPIYIREEINLFDWKISSTEKDTLIGGYSCKKATSNFRGRNYVAYFTNELANEGGPWKFDGLPGFILKVNSSDRYLSIDPIKIDVNTENEIKLTNPYLHKNTISYKQIKGVILESDNDYLKKIRSLPNPPDKIIINGPESIENFELGERVYE